MKKIFFGLITLTAGITFANNRLTTGELSIRTYYCDKAQDASFKGTVTGIGGEQRSIFFLSGLSFTDPKNKQIKIRANSDIVNLSDSGEVTIGTTQVGQIDVAALKSKIKTACEKNDADPRSIKNMAYDVPIQFMLSENTNLYYQLKKSTNDCSWVGIFNPVSSSLSGRTTETVLSDITDSKGHVLSTELVSVATQSCMSSKTVLSGLFSTVQVAVVSAKGIYYATFKSDSSIPEDVARDMKNDEK